jgi:Ca2+:H+ antiporter
VAIKDKMDLAIGVAVDSSMQIALLVTPSRVLLAWFIGADMSLFFNTLRHRDVRLSFSISVDGRLVTYLIQDGKSNYLEGQLLMEVYLI